MWKMYQYLNNYKDCINNKHISYDFRNGYNILWNEQASADHIFSEIFIGDCYPIGDNKKGKNVIVDVGANIGLFTFYAHMKFPESKIISIEANPNNFKILEKNINNNKLNDTVKIFNYVVSLHEGQQPFYLSSNSGWSSIYDKRGAKDGKLIYLEPISLSKLFQKNNLTIIDILKIDIEGAEYDILLNDKFLKNYHVKELIVEVDRKPRDTRYSFSQLIDYLQNIYGKVKINNSESEYPLIHCKNYHIIFKDNKISDKK